VVGEGSHLQFGNRSSQIQVHRHFSAQIHSLEEAQAEEEVSSIENRLSQPRAEVTPLAASGNWISSQFRARQAWPGYYYYAFSYPVQPSVSRLAHNYSGLVVAPAEAAAPRCAMSDADSRHGMTAQRYRRWDSKVGVYQEKDRTFAASPRAHTPVRRLPLEENNFFYEWGRSTPIVPAAKAHKETRVSYWPYWSHCFAVRKLERNPAWSLLRE